MDAESVKRLIRKGQSDEVIFIECPLSPLDIASEIQKIIYLQKGHIIIGVKDCGTVIGLKNKEEEIKLTIEPFLSSSNLKMHEVQLIRYFKVLVITNQSAEQTEFNQNA